MSIPSEMRKLKNGGLALESAVRMLMLTLKRMMEHSVQTLLAVVEFADYCRKQRPITEGSRRFLIEYGLMEENGDVHVTVRDTILSAGEGEGLSFRLTSPFAEE